MADNIAVTPGTGATVAADDLSGVLYQRIKVSWGVDGAAVDASASAPFPVDLANTAANATAIKVNVASGGIASGAIASGSIASGAVAAGAIAAGAFVSGSILSGALADGSVVTLGAKADAKSTATDTTSITIMQVLKQISASVQAPPSQAITIASGGIASGGVSSGAIASGAVASGAFASGALASGSIAAGAVAAGATSFVESEDNPSANADNGVKILGVRKAAPANTSGTDGDYEFLQMAAGRLWTDSVLGDGTNHAAIKAASTAAVATDPALVVAMSPNGINANGRSTPAASAPVVLAKNTYETVAASQTAQVMGGAGATGDQFTGILCIPASTSPGVVTILDNATSINVFAGGASSLSNLVPFYIPLNMVSASGAWKVTTGASMSVIGIGDFT